MKKLLVVASMAVSLAAGTALAQAATTSQAGWAADNGAAASVQAQNYNAFQTPNYNQGEAATSTAVHVGDGSRSDYLLQQHELQNTPGYNPLGTD